MMLFIKSGFRRDCLTGYHDAPSLMRQNVTFTNISYSLTLSKEDIPFEFTQGNISDENGNILMSSNVLFANSRRPQKTWNRPKSNYLMIGKILGLMPCANIILPYT